MRIRLVALALILFLTSPPIAARQAPSTRAGLVVRNVTLIDGTGAPARANVSVVVRDERVSEIVTGTDVAADLTLDGTGLFAMPGLIDAHVHLSGLPWDQRADQLRRVLQGGITSVYDVASDVRQTSDLARAAAAREIESPSIYYAALMAGPVFFTDPRVVATSRGYRPGDAPWNREITDDTDLARALAEARGGGATAIKLYAALDAATVGRIGDEARRQQMRLIAHSTVFPAKPSDLVAAGVKMLAHSAYLVWEGSPPTADFPKRARGDFAGVPVTSPAIEQLLQSMKANDVALNPTLWIFAEGPAKDDMSAQRTPVMHAVTKRAAEMGVVLAAGTDGLLNPSVDPLPILHKELEVMVAGAGLTPMQALIAATRGAAHAIGDEERRGTIVTDRAADLLLVDRNPLDDIRNTRRIRYVIKDGRIAHESPARRER